MTSLLTNDNSASANDCVTRTDLDVISALTKTLLISSSLPLRNNSDNSSPNSKNSVETGFLYDSLEPYTNNTDNSDNSDNSDNTAATSAATMDVDSFRTNCNQHELMYHGEEDSDYSCDDENDEDDAAFYEFTCDQCTTDKTVYSSRWWKSPYVFALVGTLCVIGYGFMRNKSKTN
jgi:hypothetical protein